jgi:two-component system, OmpR family, sensor histidine kinase ArlS
MVILLFISLLPWLMNKVAFEFTNYNLRQQREKVMTVIASNGIDYYLQGDSTFGSYTMLKEEYISLGPADTLTLKDTIITSARVVEGDTLNYRVLSHQFKVGERHYVLEVGKTIDTIDEYDQMLQRFALYTLTLLIGLTIIADLFFIRRLVRPLAEIVRTKILNRKFPFKDSGERIKTSTSDFRYLDDSLIALLDRVHEDFEKEREFTANASHELMTPISILQSKIENLSMSTDEEIQREGNSLMQSLARLKRIVQSLLHISRIENEQFARTEIVSLKKLVLEVLDELEHRLMSQGIEVRVDVSDDLTMASANRDLMFQLVYNLVNNAIRYNKPGGSIIIAQNEHTGHRRSLMIRDTGIGISSDLLPVIFERFRKKSMLGEESYGLGLSIVKAIADFHQIQISVCSTEGEGSTFELTW